MQPQRRLGVIERTVPYLAALVGLVGLAGAVVTELGAESRARDAAVAATQMQSAIETLGKRADALAEADDNGTVEGLLALQDRIARLETEAEAAPAPTVAAETPAPLATPATDAAAPATVADKPIDPNLPIKDCIPVGTRFMATPNESYPICQSTVVVKVGAITADAVSVAGAGEVVETGFANIAGSKCTLMVFSADAEGFAEMRVTCT
jgi:hypothetical protein